VKERLETSIGVFKLAWGERFELGSDSPAETTLTLAPESGQADRSRRTWFSSAGGIEAFLVRAGVPTDEARSLSSDLWEQRWLAEEDHRRRREEFREFRRVQDELNEQWRGMDGLSIFRLVRQWIAFVAVVEVGYDDTWEDYTNELMLREYIAELCRQLPGNRVAADLAESVAPWDERFRAATTEEPKPFGLTGDWGEEAWWAYRRPRLWAYDPD